MIKKKNNISRSEFLPCLLAVYVVAATAGMLLVYHDYYYDILETKCIYYCACTILMLILTSAWLFLTAHPVEAVKGWKGKGVFDIISPVDAAAAVWGITIVLSTILSPVRIYAFWGNGGRYAGCFVLLLYIAAYFCITRYYQMKEWHMVIFLTAGILMCLFGITDFFDMDLLGFKAEIKESQRYKFTSTIGNINTYTSCVAMVMAYGGTMFVMAKDRKKAVGYGICTMISFVALILGESDNAYLSLAAFFGLLPLYALRTKKGTRRYLILTAAFFTAAEGIGLISKQMAGQVIPISGLFQVIAGSRFLPVVILVLWLGAGGCFWLEKGSAGEDSAMPAWLTRAWLVFMILAVVAGIFVLYDVNKAGNGARYGGLQSYLLFNDGWGTNRGYVWRIAIEDYKKFSPLQQVFGYGPDTFGFITRMNNYPEMVERYQEIFDSTHNEYLQYLVTIGPLGLAAYCGTLITAAVHVARRKKNNPLAVAAFLAVVCYSFQAAVNITQPIATPVMWTLLAVSVSGSKAGAIM